MAIKKVAFEFDPFQVLGLTPPKDRALRDEALDRVAELVQTSVLEYVGDAKSPVKGGPWKRTLSPAYKKIKGEESSSTVANLELTGDMLDALEVVRKRGTKLSLQIEGEEAPKADGHNNHSGDSSLPERRFIPKGRETLRDNIWRDVKRILQEYEDE